MCIRDRSGARRDRRTRRPLAPDLAAAVLDHRERAADRHHRWFDTGPDASAVPCHHRPRRPGRHPRDAVLGLTESYPAGSRSDADHLRPASSGRRAPPLRRGVVPREHPQAQFPASDWSTTSTDHRATTSGDHTQFCARTGHPKGPYRTSRGRPLFGLLRGATVANNVKIYLGEPYLRSDRDVSRASGMGSVKIWSVSLHLVLVPGMSGFLLILRLGASPTFTSVGRTGHEICWSA